LGLLNFCVETGLARSAERELGFFI